MTYPFIPLSPLPPNTVIPEDEILFIQYLNRLYEDIAFAVNERDNTAFTIPISSVPQDIPNVPNFGAFLVCVSGIADTVPPLAISTFTAPTLNASLCKSDSTAPGVINVLGFQAGTGPWAGFVLTITSTATNFQIAHNRGGVTGNFNLRVVGTQ